MTTGMPSRGWPPAGERALYAEIGDMLVIDDSGMAGLPRIGTIIAVTGPDGSPPYLVRWLAGDYESRIRPGRGARVERRCPAPRRPAN